MKNLTVKDYIARNKQNAKDNGVYGAHTAINIDSHTRLYIDCSRGLDGKFRTKCKLWKDTNYQGCITIAEADKLLLTMKGGQA